MSLDTFLWISSAVVIVGVTLEEIHLYFEIKEKGWRHVFWELRWKTLISRLGFVILIIGLAGELLFQTLIASRDAELKRESDEKIASLNKDTGVLRDRAASAELNIAIANQKASEADSRTASLLHDFGDLNQLVKSKVAEIDSAKNQLKKDIADLDRARDDALKASSDAKKSLAEATILISEERTLQRQVETKLSDAKRENLSINTTLKTLKSVIGAREISEGQKSALSDFLKTKPKGTLHINAVALALDSEFYANEISDVFKSSGWNVVVEVTGYSYFDQGMMGNWISFGGSSMPETAHVVFEAMNAASVPMRDVPNHETDLDATPKKVVLNIGHK